MNSFVEYMLYRLFFLFCLYLPFQLALNPTEGIDLASSRVFILILFFLWMAEGLKNKRFFINSTGFSFLFSSFLFLSVFSMVVSNNIDWSLRKSAFLVSVAPIFFVSSAIFANNYNIMRRMLRLLVFSGFLVAIIGIIQFSLQFIFGIEAVYGFWAKNLAPLFLGNSFSQAVLKNPSWLVNVSGHTLLRSTGTFPDPHMFSFYLGMLIPISLAFFLIEKKIKHLWIFIILTVADLLTFSRGGYLGLFFAGVFFLIFFWEIIEKKYRKITLAVIFLSIVIVGFPSPVSQRFFSIFDLKEGSNLGRMETWKKAIDIVASNPIIGVGIGNYPLEIKPTADYREPIYAHSVYLDVAAETGIINALIWMSALFLVFFSYLKKAKKDLIYFGLALSVFIFSIHSIVETAIYSQTVLALFLMIASCDAVSCKEDINYRKICP